MRRADPVHFQHDEGIDATHADDLVSVCVRCAVGQVLPSRAGQIIPFPLDQFPNIETVPGYASQVEIIVILVAADHPILARISDGRLGTHVDEDILNRLCEVIGWK